MLITPSTSTSKPKGLLVFLLFNRTFVLLKKEKNFQKTLDKIARLWYTLDRKREVNQKKGIGKYDEQERKNCTD